MYDIRNLNIWKAETKKDRRNREFLEADIVRLELSARAYHCLRRVGCNTVGEVLRIMEEDGEKGLMCIRNLGRMSAKEISEKIEAYREVCG